MAWPQPRRRSREDGIVDKFPLTAAHNALESARRAGYAGPAVANGKVFVTDRVAPDDTPPKEFKNGPSKERVFCLDEPRRQNHLEARIRRNTRLLYPLGSRTTPLVCGGKATRRHHG